MRSMYRTRFALVIAVVIFSGCRTYGGYDSEALTAEVIEQLSARAAELARLAEGEYDLLRQAAGQDVELGAYAASYGELIERNRQLAQDLSEKPVPGDYRGIRRAAGAAITEINMLQTGYSRIKGDIARLRGVSVMNSNVADGLSYEAVPPYYRRIRLDPAVSMRDALGVN